MNTLRLLSEFHAGSLTLADTWRAMLAPATARDRPGARRPRPAGSATPRGRKLGVGGDVASTTATTLEMADAVAAFHFPDDVWARVVYDLVVAARDPKPSIETLVAALVPIYFGRVGSFVIENRHGDDRARPRSASSARRASSSSSSRTSSERWKPRRAPTDMTPSRRSPARILIPVANPMTAEELIRLGAAMLDPRDGELSALGIVEVPEGMPLSEGATRARHARRLLQKVLDYAPRRHDDPSRSCGSAGTPPRASSRRPPSRRRT